MTTVRLIFIALGLSLFAGCAETPTSSGPAKLRLGMSRDELRLHVGEPLRIVPTAGGAEDWIYNFSSWKGRPTGSSETTEEFGQKNSSVSIGWETSKVVEEKAVHVSAEGFVVEPLPEGKVVL